MAYCTIQDVKDWLQVSDEEIEDVEISRRIEKAEQWVNAYQQTTYSGTIPDLIKDATAKYAAGMIADFLFTTDEPNASGVGSRLKKEAKEFLDLYAKDTFSPSSSVEKVNSGFF